MSANVFFDWCVFSATKRNLFCMTNDTDHYGSDRCASMTDEGLALKTVVLIAAMWLLSQRSTAPSSLQPFSKPFGWQGSGSSGRRLLSFWYFSFWPRRKKKYIAYVNDTFIGKMGKRDIFPRDVDSLFRWYEKEWIDEGVGNCPGSVQKEKVHCICKRHIYRKNG